MAEFYLQTPSGHWELVDDFIWANWKHAHDDDKPRYNGNRVKTEDGKVTLDLTGPVTPRELALIARFTGAGADLNPNTVVPGGIVKEPEFVMLKRNNQTILKKVGGQKFVAKAA